MSSRIVIRTESPCWLISYPEAIHGLGESSGFRRNSVSPAPKNLTSGVFCSPLRPTNFRTEDKATVAESGAGIGVEVGGTAVGVGLAVAVAVGVAVGSGVAVGVGVGVGSGVDVAVGAGTEVGVGV